ncbi:cell division protein FtsK [Kribbella sp. CA-247076]|uniref:cell division protein FtsK n=1 Tax=Kribbella sp. CA-247076 TaxID=3239941 RepID=UPI003D8A9D9E
MPNQPRLSRRRVVVTAAVVPGAVALAACTDDSSGSGTQGGAKNSDDGVQPAEETPSTDPAVVAALTAAATVVTQLSLRYTASSAKFPALRTRLAAGAKYHASHLTRLKAVPGVQVVAGKAPAVPSTSAAALADLAKRETAAAVAHAAGAGKLSGEHARLLAMIAASETQLAATLTPKKKADSE